MFIKNLKLLALSVIITAIGISACDENEAELQAIDEYDPFITRWEITKASESITIPTNSDYSYDYSVDWGDGSDIETHTGNVSHTYAQSGIYTVKIAGQFPAIYFGNGDPKLSISRLSILDVISWGGIEWKTMEHAFQDCSNLKVTAIDAPDLSEVRDMSGMFAYASSFNQDLSHWDVSKVEDMSDMFAYASSFDQDLSDWDVSKVTNMAGMFEGAISFNQPLNWDVSSVAYMDGMFSVATSFNQPLDWDVSSVTSMTYMFYITFSFNQPLNWDVSSVTDMKSMFRKASSFDQDLSGWNTENVTNCTSFSYKSALEESHLPNKGCFAP
ncbi:BspA family leucine-rich repeat surface protein [Reichenbachiella versicolor]|uniref:BspA family leucine-rich repeat surface protein n=1 Tax=Reichenbachiella versicolor TaxID=1821036 RepID=UPI000D6DEEAD|nr:BspA family leucine-rich repeat surface protein [Reichenbachiella versicolor]